MVVVSELTSIFWGVALKGGNKKYTQKTERPVHISMAALDPAQPHDNSPVSLMIEQDGKSYILCNLMYGSLLQQPLDLEFASGEELTFYVTGKGVVHLSGYLMPEDEFPDYGPDGDDSDSSSQAEEASESDDGSEDEKDKAVVKSGKKRLKAEGASARNASKKAKLTIDDIDSEDDDDDDDFIDDEAIEDSDDDDDSDEMDDDDDEDDDDEVSDSEEEADLSLREKGKGSNDARDLPRKTPKDKTSSKAAVVDMTPNTKESKPTPAKNKQENKPATPQQQQSTSQQGGGDASSLGEGKNKKKKNKKKKKKSENQQQAESGSPAPTASAGKLPAKRVAAGGVVVEDLKEGHGPEAKLGKMLRVYYTGRLQNGKIFDSMLSGNGFKFKLGKKEVISGWDAGLDGMKVGGKRKLIVPPKMGYGGQAAGSIPPNSTLIFDVELKSVN